MLLTQQIKAKASERAEIAKQIRAYKKAGNKIEKIKRGVSGANDDGRINSEMSKESERVRKNAIKASKLAARQAWGREGKAI